MATKPRDWAPIFRNILLFGGLGSSWWTMSTGEMPYSMWLGIAAIILAGALGSNLVMVGSALALFFLRYGLFVMPTLDLLHSPRLASGLAAVLFSAWESAPLWVAGVAGVWLLRRKTIHSGIAFGLPAALFLTLAAWMPRPYYFSWGAPFLSRFPGFIWMFGSDLLAALLLGWLCVAARVLVYQQKNIWTTAAVAGSPILAFIVCLSSFEAWSGSMIKAEKVPHDVIAVQGGLPPYAGGYAVTMQRLFTPTVLYSALRPDLIIFPECMAQVADKLDKNDADSVSQRRFAAIATGMAAPYSQVLFGCRDWNVNRIMFSDLIDGKPDITWKDAEFRTPFVDSWPAWSDVYVHRYGFARIYEKSEQINPAERTPALNILIRDASQPRGLRRIGSAEIFMSGEIRRPRLVTRIRKTTDHTVLVNPTIGGWMGGAELRGSVLQSDARALELGQVLYRVGQLGGTGLFVPWLPDPEAEVIRNYGAGIKRFRANIPVYRHDTGYTMVFWTALYIAPFLSGILAAYTAWMLWRARQTALSKVILGEPLGIPA